MSLSDLIPPPSVLAAILERRRLRNGFRRIYSKYRAYTMIHEAMYVNNLELCAKFGATPGCVVECGVWRGGMSAGMAEVLGADRDYFLFDSFEGLPPAREDLDGASAVAWQSNTAVADLLQQLHRRGRGSGGSNEAFRRNFILARQGMVQ